MLPIDLEVGGIDQACAGCPGNHFLSLSFADLEIVIEEASRVDLARFSGVRPGTRLRNPGIRFSCRDCILHVSRTKLSVQKRHVRN